MATENLILGLLQLRDGYPFHLYNLFRELGEHATDLKAIRRRERVILHLLIKLVREGKVERCCRNLYQPAWPN